MALTVVDAGVVIGFLDETDAHHRAARAALEDAVERADRLVLPASGYAEALVGPSRRGADAVAIVDRFFARLPIEIVPLGTEVAAAAAGLRARHRSVKLPDALIIATAIVLDADRVLTTDRRWPPKGKLGLRATISSV